MKQPRLGVKTRAPGFVGDLYVGTQASKLVEGPSFGAVRVGRCKHPKRPTRLAVAAQLGDEWKDSGPTDERHDHIDGPGTVDFGPQLMGDGRFTGALVRSVVSTRGVRGRCGLAASPVGRRRNSP